jgi:hypothetical protein
MRETIYDFIEVSVWHQLLLQAAAHIQETGETKNDWEEDVLDHFYKDLYEDADTRDAVVDNLRRDVRSTDHVPTLVQRIDKAIQRRLKTPTKLQHLLEEGGFS